MSLTLNICSSNIHITLKGNIYFYMHSLPVLWVWCVVRYFRSFIATFTEGMVLKMLHCPSLSSNSTYLDGDVRGKSILQVFGQEENSRLQDAKWLNDMAKWYDWTDPVFLNRKIYRKGTSVKVKVDKIHA